MRVRIAQKWFKCMVRLLHDECVLEVAYEHQQHENMFYLKNRNFFKVPIFYHPLILTSADITVSFRYVYRIKCFNLEKCKLE